jgi:hypothetical protein
MYSARLSTGDRMFGAIAFPPHEPSSSCFLLKITLLTRIDLQAPSHLSTTSITQGQPASAGNMLGESKTSPEPSAHSGMSPEDLAAQRSVCVVEPPKKCQQLPWRGEWFLSRTPTGSRRGGPFFNRRRMAGISSLPVLDFRMKLSSSNRRATSEPSSGV